MGLHRATEYHTARARAERTARMIVERARRTALEAGLPAQACFHMAHNASVGERWPGLDYAKVRKVRWLEQRSWEPGRLLDRWVARTGALKHCRCCE